KGKFDGISAELSSKTSELEKANSLIEEMKKASKGNEDMQGKISEYETQVTALQKELLEIKLSNAVKVALLSENAADVDYLTYKLNEKLSAEGKTLELDDNGSIKGIDGELTALKTAYPNMFVKGNNDGYTVIGDNRLPDTQRNNAMSKAELLKKPYAERVKFYNENPDAYKELMK
ncbi:MAG: phage scaffolding protein, partial [Ruminiclostridium sp.]|nr:phage scaffolding protein [Ruminiclostridium sp.]